MCGGLERENTSPFDESNFGSNPSHGIAILHISMFVIIKIIGIDPVDVIVGNLVMAIIHNGFNTLVVMWLRLENGIRGTWVVAHSLRCKTLLFVNLNQVMLMQ
jgi:hypothetical protein